MHNKIAEIDGINRRVMQEINELIDIFHTERYPGINPEHAEWVCCPVVINALLNMEKEGERIESVKAALHHYILDFLEKTKIVDLEIAKNRGLKGVRDYLKGIDPKMYNFFQIYGFIERWYFLHNEEDTKKIMIGTKNLVEDLASFFIDGIFLYPHIRREGIQGYYECWRCGYICSPDRAKELGCICPKCGDLLHMT